MSPKKDGAPHAGHRDRVMRMLAQASRMPYIYIYIYNIAAGRADFLGRCLLHCIRLINPKVSKVSFSLLLPSFDAMGDWQVAWTLFFSYRPSRSLPSSRSSSLNFETGSTRTTPKTRTSPSVVWGASVGISWQSSTSTRSWHQLAAAGRYL